MKPQYTKFTGCGKSNAQRDSNIMPMLRKNKGLESIT